MRQILIGAWLVVACSVAPACGGDQFSSSPPSGANDGATASGDTGGHRSQTTPPTASGVAGQASLMPSAGSTSAGAFGATGGYVATGGSSSTGGGKASGGASSAGTGTGSGGTSNSGGATGEGGASEDACASGAITFRMLPGPALANDYLCDAGCGTGWLTITDPEGATAFSIFAACGTASCDACALQPCAAAACLPQPLTAKGSELVWNGTYMAKDTCGPTSMACQQEACVKPGRYKAKACAAVSGGNAGGSGCVPKSEQVCATAEFEFPSTQTVRLVLSPK